MGDALAAARVADGVGDAVRVPAGRSSARALSKGAEDALQPSTAMATAAMAKLDPDTFMPQLHPTRRIGSDEAACRVGSMVKVGSIVLRVDDLQRETEFWSKALDYVPRGREHGDDETFVLLRPRNGQGPNISLDRVRSALQIPPRIHLDLYSEDQAADVARLKGLGATEVQWERRPADADYVILADPEGNRFCVVDVTR
jgi:catechol 2,3-dioxygenase-like lactoylglutathione lyase family enzyme